MNNQELLAAIRKEAAGIFSSLDRDYKGSAKDGTHNILGLVSQLEKNLENTFECDPELLQLSKEALEASDALLDDGEAVHAVVESAFATLPEGQTVALNTPEQVQWQNIRTAVQEVAKFCFGDANSDVQVSCGAAFTSVMMSLTAKDGVSIKLRPLPSTPHATPLSVEDILLLVGEHTGQRINLDLKQLDEYIAFARAVEASHRSNVAVDRAWVRFNSALKQSPDADYAAPVISTPFKPQSLPNVSAPKTVVWWDRAVGGFYLSRESIPESVHKRGGIVELVPRDSKASNVVDEDAENAARWREVLKIVSDREVMFAGFPAQAFSLSRLRVDHSIDISQNTAIHFTDAIDKSRQRLAPK